MVLELYLVRTAVGIWDRLPANSLEPAKATGDSSSSPSGSKENIPMQTPAMAAPAQGPAKGQRLAGEVITPGAGEYCPHLVLGFVGHVHPHAHIRSGALGLTCRALPSDGGLTRL